MISHLDHIVLTVADIERAVSFYENTLKMKAISFGDGRRAVLFGNQKINFQLLGEEIRNHAMEGSGDLCLISDWPMEKITDYLKECQVVLLEGPVTKSGAQGPIESVYFNDPDNNLIEISVYLENSDTSSEDTKSEEPKAKDKSETDTKSSPDAKSRPRSKTPLKTD